MQTPINKLSDDILSYLLLRVPCDFGKTRSYLLRVCHRWREVLYHLPSFWQHIRVHRRSEWLELCLARCAGAPADIEFHLDDSEEFPMHAIPPLLLRYVHTIRSLTFFIIKRPKVWESWTAHVLTQTPMSVLEMLSVKVTTSYGADGLQLDIPLDRVPALRDLRLNNAIVFPTTLPLTLRTLKMYRCEWSIPLLKFLNMLEACTALEHILFKDSLSKLTNIQDLGHPLLRSPVRLQRVRKLTIIDVDKGTMYPQILRHFRFPAVVDLKLHQREVFFQFHLVPYLLPPDSSSTFPLLIHPTSFTHATVGGHGDSTYSIALHNPSNPDRKLTLSIRNFEPRIVGDYAFRDLIALRGFLITSLVLCNTVVREHVSDEHKQEWRDFTAQVASLEHLEIRDWQHPAVLWACLRAASTEDGVCWPRLVSVTMSDMKWVDAETLELATSVLRERAERGSHLDTLSLSVRYPTSEEYIDETHTEEEYENIRSRYMARLAEIVPTVNFTRCGANSGASDDL
ncbi:hypothetical protein C8Q76DRAFT_796748 [Earliella scabrosa]|nr:hypothetical protein C8Q76DRAFT_796748 [Earliella scabrosa]